MVGVTTECSLQRPEKWSRGDTNMSDMKHLILKTPTGDRRVSAGDLLFFPASSEGAHKLTNTSATEKLVYIDFDVIRDLDVAIYPDSDKIGV